MKLIEVYRRWRGKRGGLGKWERGALVVTVTADQPRPEAGIPAPEGSGRTWLVPPHKDKDARPCIGWAQEAPEAAGVLAGIID